MNQRVAELAIDYGRMLMQKITGVACGSSHTDDTWQPWTKYLWPNEDLEPLAMQSAWSLITIGKQSPDPKYVPIHALSLADHDGEWELNPCGSEDKVATAAPALGRDFVTHGGATETDFDRFYYLMQKYASTLPCTYGEEGVSLFRQWGMVAALMALTEGEVVNTLPNLALIGLDLPGIQTMVYTITARGAGKGVRGRSAFVQLLISAVVDKLLDELDLCLANVIINAGGNALILCRHDKALEQMLKGIEQSINRILFNGGNLRGGNERDARFTGFKGDLALALAHVKLPQSTLKYPVHEVRNPNGSVESEWQQVERALKEALSTAKQQPFRTMMADQRVVQEEDETTLFELFFTPDAADSERFCAVCRRPAEKGEKFAADPELEATTVEPNVARCPECKGFEELARRLAKETAFLVRRDHAARPGRASGWQRVLNNISGYWYSIEERPVKDALSLAFNLDDFPSKDVHIDGFRLLATATPTEANGSIRDNNELAEDTSSSLKRLGVLKADVDNLAQLLVNSLAKRSAAQTAMLSDSLTLFFGGWLDKLCTDLEIAAGVQTRDKVYVLYAGGDDLLIIGSWDVMPYLAQRIARDFNLFTGRNPGVHLSAGIVLVRGKEPLYAASESANDELDKAKGKGEPDPKKNAINFLGKTYGWNDFAKIIKWQEKLVELRNTGAPASLIGTLLTIYAQYQRDRGKIPGIKARCEEGTYRDQKLFMGPWLWKMIYQLSRIVRDKEQEQSIAEIQRYLLNTGGIERMSVSARWAQFLTREGSQNDQQQNGREPNERSSR